MMEIVNILLLEDLKTDAELIQRAIHKVAPQVIFTVANSRAAFEEKLGWGTYDAVLADYHLPGYNGLEALLHVRENFGSLPFIFVTGSLDDEEAVAQTILRGADGYLLKNNLSNLGVYFDQVIKRIQARDESRRKKEELLRNRMLQLQKLTELIQQSTDFKAKEEALQILHDLVGEPLTHEG